MKLIILFLIFLSTLYGNFDRHEALKLLDNKNYAKLCKNFDNLQKEIKDNPNAEIKLYNIFKIFSNNDILLEDKLKDWIKSNPNCAYSHAALGIYYINAGWVARGDKFNNQTSKEQFKKMYNFFKKASNQLHKSIEIDNKFAFAYSYLITINPYKYRKEIYKEGIKSVPYSYFLRSAYLNTLLPKFMADRKREESLSEALIKENPIGSLLYKLFKKDKKAVDPYEEIQKVLNENKKYYSKNPLLKRFEGFVEYAKADTTYIQGNYELAKKYINQALSKSSGISRFYDLRASINWGLKKYQDAVVDYTKSLKIEPNRLSARYYRAKLYYYHLKNKELALKDLQYILKYDSKYVNALDLMGVIEYNNREYQKAYDRFFDANLIDSKDRLSNYYLGILAYYNKKDYQSSAMYLENALKSGERSSLAYKLLSISKWQEKSCDFVKYAYKYKEQCTKDGDCDIDAMNGMIKNAEFAKQRGICN